MKNELTIRITREEALVLFAFLGRVGCEKPSQLFEDQAEQRVLWNIESLLERELVEPLQANYLELLKKAREHLRDEAE